MNSFLLNCHLPEKLCRINAKDQRHLQYLNLGFYVTHLKSQKRKEGCFYHETDWKCNNNIRSNNPHICKLLPRKPRAVLLHNVSLGTGRNSNNLFRVQIGGDSRLHMLEQSEKDEKAQEAQESEDVVRQSAEDYLKEILGKEQRIWRN